MSDDQELDEIDDIEAAVGIYIPQDICWTIMVFCEISEVYKASRINKTFHSVVEREKFWEEYAENLHLKKMEEKDSWRETVEKFYVTNSMLYFDGISQRFSITFYVVGSKNSGKTLLCKNFFKMNFSKKIRGKVLKGNDKKFTVGVLRDFVKSGLLLLVFDLSREESFERIYRLKDELKTVPYRNLRMLLVGCKSDLKQGVSGEKISELSKELGVNFYSCSATKDQGVTRVFDGLVKKNLVGWEFYNKVHKLKSNEKKLQDGCTIL